MPSFQSQNPKRNAGRSWWDILKLVGRDPFTGHLAGPPVGVACHFIGARRACRHEMTGGALECPYCADGQEPRFTGYVPLWDATGRRWLLIMGDRHWPAIKDVPHLTTVRAVKTASRGEAIYCGRAVKQVAPPELVGADKREQDITGVLLTMWGDEQLREWCAAQAVAKKAAAPAAPAKPPRKRPSSPVPADAQELAERTPAGWVAGVAESLSMAEVFPDLAARFARRRAEPSVNGDHKPKPK